MTKKLLSALLSLLLICGILPSFALADVFDPHAEAHIPVYMDGTVEADWNGETNVFTVTVKNEISKREWAYLYQYYRNNAGTKLLLDYEMDIPEGTADCIFCSPSNGYTFGDFQDDYQRIGDYKDGTEGFDCFSLEGDRRLGSRLFIADCSLNSGSVTITPRKDSYEEYYAWLNESGNAISYSNIKYVFTPECGEATFSEEELLSEKFNEHRIRLADDGFFESWDEEELITSFGPDEAGISVELLYPGDADFDDSIECEFVDGILEVTLHEMSPELLKEAYDINSDTQGDFSLQFKITLPKNTLRMSRSQGNGRYDKAKELLDEPEELQELNPEEDRVLYGSLEFGRLVKDGSVVTYFPEKDSGLFGCFIGYEDENRNIYQRALMIYVTSAEDSHSVSFINPHPIVPVDISQIEVDERYSGKMRGRENAEAEYGDEDYIPFYKDGQLLYKYLGSGETPEDIVEDLGFNDGDGILPRKGSVDTRTVIHAPEEGYVLNGTYNKDGDLISNGNEIDTETTTVWCDFGEDGGIINQNAHYTFVWENKTNHSLLYQEIYITNDFGKPFTFYDIHWDVPDQSRIQFYSETLGKVMTDQQLAENGIHVSVDPERGFVYTTFDRGAKLNEVGEVLAFILPPKGAVYCKTSNGGGSTEMPRYSQRDADDLRHVLDTYEFEPVGTGDDFYQMHCYPLCLPAETTIETSDGDSITIWYTRIISVENFVVEWYDEEEQLIEGNYLFGTMDDLAFVQETDSIEESKIDGSIEFPTLIQANGNSQNRKLQSKINPQSSENSTLIELRALWENDPDEIKQIFIPREYLNYDGEWGEENVNFTITHYEGIEDLAELEEAAKNGKGVEALCEFNEYGLYIYTKSFSPFMIEWEATENPEDPEKPEKPERQRRRSSGGEKIILDGDSTNPGETNPDTGAFVPEKPVELLAAGMILSFAIMSLSKNK